MPYRKEPVSFKGEYKYKGGPVYRRTKEEKEDDKIIVTSEVVPGMIDSCSINAVLYEVTNYSESLTGVDANTSPKIAAIASLPEGSDKAVFTTFDVKFKWMNGKTYDATKKYKFAIICSSSARGDKFEGAPESELLIKSFEVTTVK